MLAVVLSLSLALPPLRVQTPDAGTIELAAPCEVSGAAVAHAGWLYVPCGAVGVALYELSGGTAKLAGISDVGGEVVGLHVAGERVWVELRRVEARPIDAARLLAEAPPSSPGAPPVAPRPAAESGQILSVRSDGVVVSLGTAQGLAPGDRVELFVPIDVDLGAGVHGTREEIAAVGVVTAASDSSAHVRLGRNEQVPAEARARETTDGITASRVLPPRPAGTWSASFSLRPFLALGALGFGTVSDASVGYRHERSVRLQAVFEPLGFGFADVGNIVATAGTLIVSYDETLFEVGLGGGWSAVNNDLPDVQVSAAADGSPIRSTVDNVQSGYSISQLARLGSDDGLHLQVRNTFILYDDAFHYGSTVGRLAVPVSDRSQAFGQGGGGAAGFAYGELGLRWLLFGRGLRDSFFVSASLGGAFLFGERKVAFERCEQRESDVHLDAEGVCLESVDYGGPMVGLTVEWRL